LEAAMIDNVKQHPFLWAAAAATLGGASAAVIAGAASNRWSRATEKLANEVCTSVRQAGVVRLDELGTLPIPVQRYFRRVLREAQPIVLITRMQQSGKFSWQKGAWTEFAANEVLSLQPRAFVWDARVAMAPLVNIRVRDRYIGGRGGMEASAAGLFDLAHVFDRPELNAGALHRFLAEAVWFPTALLPSAGVTWTAIDDSRAMATLSDAGTTVSLDFTFATTGEVTGVFTPGRYRAVENEQFVRTPWGSRCSAYAERGGMRIPTECEVFWQIDGDIQPYWRGRIDRVAYEFAKKRE
jgi:hypothetical protein